MIVTVIAIVTVIVIVTVTISLVTSCHRTPFPTPTQASAQASLSTVNRLVAELNGINVTEILTSVSPRVILTALP